MVHVFVEAENAYDVGSPRHVPVQLYLPPGLGAVVEDLEKHADIRVQWSLEHSGLYSTVVIIAQWSL